MKKFLSWLVMIVFEVLTIFSLYCCTETKNDLLNDNQNQNDTNTGPIVPGDTIPVGAYCVSIDSPYGFIVTIYDCVNFIPCEDIELCSHYEVISNVIHTISKDLADLTYLSNKPIAYADITFTNEEYIDFYLVTYGNGIIYKFTEMPKIYCGDSIAERVAHIDAYLAEDTALKTEFKEKNL